MASKIGKWLIQHNYLLVIWVSMIAVVSGVLSFPKSPFFIAFVVFSSILSTAAILGALLVSNMVNGLEQRINKLERALTGFVVGDKSKLT